MGNERIGVIIHNRRKELGITLEQIGNACGLNKSTIMRWEKGIAKDIKRSHIDTLSKLLCIPIPVLLGLESEENIEEASIVIERNKILSLLNEIKDISKLENIEKYIKVFVLWKRAFTTMTRENLGIFIQA